jgi:hypothetical protein
LFPAGSSGQAAQTIRGFGAHKFMIDEADYLDIDTYGTVMPMVNEHPNNQFWMCSTPTGKRERFYEFCRDSRYREWHVTIYDRPDVTDELIEDCRKDAGTDMRFRLEFLAEFGDSLTGVFKKEDIDLALRTYDLGNYRKDAELYIGVDWNEDDIGDEFAVLENRGGILQLVDLINISAAERTQVDAMEMIIRMNRELPNLRGIYCDARPGQFLIQWLWNMGKESKRAAAHPLDSRLEKIIHAVDFGSKIEIIKPSTNETENVRTKPFMTERTVWYLENKRLILPYSLDAKDLLGFQMRDYRVEKYNNANVPIYSGGNQHSLMALMLAILGYDLENDIFGKIVLPQVAMGVGSPAFTKQFISLRTTSFGQKSGARPKGKKRPSFDYATKRVFDPYG